MNTLVLECYAAFGCNMLYSFENHSIAKAEVFF
jgi:hypothetical protein